VKARLLWLWCLCAAYTGCSDDLDPSSRLIELRLLAVEADRPFAQPGEQVELSALPFDPESRPLSWGWGTCVDAASSVASDCLQTVAFDDLTVSLDAPRHTLTMPQTDAPYVGVVVVLCPGTIARGGADGMPVSCIDAGGRALSFSEFEVGVKRIFKRDSMLNQNPVIEQVRWEGEVWPEGELKISACKKPAEVCDEFIEHELEVLAPGAAQTSVDAEQKPITELAVTQWYATAGTFDDEVRVFDKAQNTWHARAEDAGKLVTLWFVVRDDRGGVTWTSRQIQVPAS